MATADDIGLVTPSHPTWKSFSPQQQLSLIEEDLRAGYSVPLVLIAPMLVGIVLGIVTLWLCL